MLTKGKLSARQVPRSGVSGLTGSRVTTMLLLAFTSVCFAEGSPPGSSADSGKRVLPVVPSTGTLALPASLDRQEIAPNQSASLDETQPVMLRAAPVDHGPESVMDSGDVSGKSAVSKRMVEARDISGSKQVATRDVASMGRRVPRELDSAARPAATLPDVPWYRTGLGALGIVLAVIAATVWGIRRWMPTFGGTSCSVLNVVGRAGLTSKHSVALVSLGHRLVLIGLSGDRMTPICEVSDPHEVAELTLRLGSSKTRASAKAFDSLLAGEVDEYAKVSRPVRKDADRTKEHQGKAAPEPLRALLERLRSLQVK